MTDHRHITVSYTKYNAIALISICLRMRSLKFYPILQKKYDKPNGMASLRGDKFRMYRSIGSFPEYLLVSQISLRLA